MLVKSILYIVSGVILTVLVPVVLFFGAMRINALPRIYESTALGQIVVAEDMKAESNYTAMKDVVDSHVKTFKTNAVLEQVAQNLGLERKWSRMSDAGEVIMPLSDVISRLDASVDIVPLQDNSGRIKISSRSEDPEESAIIADEMISCYNSFMSTLQGTTNLVVVVLESGKVPKKTSYPNYLVNVLIVCISSAVAGIIGMALFVNGVKLKVIYDRTMK